MLIHKQNLQLLIIKLFATGAILVQLLEIVIYNSDMTASAFKQNRILKEFK